MQRCLSGEFVGAGGGVGAGVADGVGASGAWVQVWVLVCGMVWVLGVHR